MKRLLYVTLGFLFVGPAAPQLLLTAPLFDVVRTAPSRTAGGGGGGTTLPVSDSTSIVEDNGDGTKELRFEVSGITTGTVRTLTPQNNSYIIAGTNIQNSFTSRQLFGSGGIYLDLVESTNNPFMSEATAQTPDAGTFGIGDLSNSWVFMQNGDQGTDGNNGPCAGVQCGEMAVIVYGTTPAANKYGSLGSYGTARRFTTTLTESVATPVVQVPVAAETGTGGMLYYTIYATDGSTPQVRQGRVLFSVTADGATETCVLGTPEETDNTPTGTLTVTVACDTSPANAVNFTLNATSSLAQTTLENYGSVDLIGLGLPLPQ